MDFQYVEPYQNYQPTFQYYLVIRNKDSHCDGLFPLLVQLDLSENYQQTFQYYLVIRNKDSHCGSLFPLLAQLDLSSYWVGQYLVDQA